MPRRILTAREQYEMLSPWLREAGVIEANWRDARIEQIGVGGRLPTDEVMKYFHSVVTPGDLDPGFDADVRANGVHTPIEISTDGVRAAITDGHHRSLSAQGGGLPDVPVHVFHVPSSSMTGDRGAHLGDHLRSLLQSYPEPTYREAGVVPG